MRTPDIATMPYYPGPVPSDPEQIPRYLESEFMKIAAAIQRLQEGHVDVTYVAPAKPREGDFRLADGSSWNPLGTGKKFVGYRGGTWVLLG